MTTFHIVRHGRTQWNEKGLLQGHSDSPLTEEAIELTKQAAEKLAHIRFDQVYSSDLLRAKRTAELLVEQRELVVKTTEVLRERHLGRFEGKPFADLETELKEQIALMERMQTAERLKSQLDPELASDDTTANRVLRFIKDLALSFEDESILIVTHSGVLKSILIHLGFADYQTLGSIKNLARVVLDCDGVEFWVRETEGVEKKELKIDDESITFTERKIV